MGRILAEGERPLHWIGSAKRDFLAFPKPVRGGLGYALGLAQLGGTHPSAKPWKGLGPGVFEVVEPFDGDTYRTIYTVRLSGAVYVLDAFQKKSPSGVRTAQVDVDRIERRLRAAERDCEGQDG